MNVCTYKFGYFSGSVFQETNGSNELDCKRIYGRLYYTHCNLKICKKKDLNLILRQEKKVHCMKICLNLIYWSHPGSKLLSYSYKVHTINFCIFGIS